MLVSDHAHEDPNQADEENNGGKEEDFHRFDTEHIPPSLNGEAVQGDCESSYTAEGLSEEPSGLVCIADLFDCD